VVAFISTVLVLVLGVMIMRFVAKRRPIGTPYSWGEAMVAGTFVFFMIFWAYGVVPHFLLTWADSELNWRPDVALYEYSWLGGVTLGFFQPQEAGGWFPISINMQHVRDILVVGLYGILLGLNVYLFAWWQKRGTTDTTTAELVTSDFGRPLVRKG
jgi:hypothetical protein